MDILEGASPPNNILEFRDRWCQRGTNKTEFSQIFLHHVESGVTGCP